MEQTKTKKSTTVVFIVLTAVFAALMVAAVLALFINTNKMNAYGSNLEYVYQRSYYDLEDNINNAENKLGKLMASSSGNYQKKLVKEISANAKAAQENLNILPVSAGGINDSIKFINQFYGYMSSLETSIEKTSKLTPEQKQKVGELHQAIKEMKFNLDSFTKKLAGGYSILKASKNLEGDFNNLTNDLRQIKTDDIEYPSMIYDGPFSDSVTNVEIKGLFGENVDSIQAEKNLREIYTGKNLENFKYLGQTNGKFKTHDFSFYLDGTNQFAQITEVGGRLLTVSGGVAANSSNISFENAQKLAIDFCKKAGIKDVEVVWSDEKESEAYFNIAPVQNGIILYPDLIKIKVDKSTGNIAGFEACAYFTNHTNRSLATAKISGDKAKNTIENGYNIQTTKLCLVPLDYNREVLCYEFKCDNLGSIYFIYINAESGVEENILQVVSSESGQKLM